MLSKAAQCTWAVRKQSHSANSQTKTPTMGFKVKWTASFPMACDIERHESTLSTTPTILQSDRGRLRCHIQLKARDFPRLVQTQQQPIMRFQTVQAQTTFLSTIFLISKTQSIQLTAMKSREEPFNETLTLNGDATVSPRTSVSANTILHRLKWLLSENARCQPRRGSSQHFPKPTVSLPLAPVFGSVSSSVHQL